MVVNHNGGREKGERQGSRKIHQERQPLLVPMKFQPGHFPPPTKFRWIDSPGKLQLRDASTFVASCSMADVPRAPRYRVLCSTDQDSPQKLTDRIEPSEVMSTDERSNHRPSSYLSRQSFWENSCCEFDQSSDHRIFEILVFSWHVHTILQPRDYQQQGIHLFYDKCEMHFQEMVGKKMRRVVERNRYHCG